MTVQIVGQPVIAVVILTTVTSTSLKMSSSAPIVQKAKTTVSKHQKKNGKKLNRRHKMKYRTVNNTEPPAGTEE